MAAPVPRAAVGPPPAGGTGRREPRPALRRTLLALIVAAGAGLRLAGLAGQGLLYWDEGLFLLGARFLRWRIADLAGLAEGPMTGFPVFLDKPAHVCLLALVGGRLGPIAGARLSAVAGTLTLLVVYAAGRRLAGAWAGLAAGAVLACSSYHVLYSRAGLHEADSALVAAAAVLLVLGRAGREPRPAGRLAAGLLFGTAVLMSYRTIVLGPLVLGLDALWRLVAGGPASLRRSWRAELAAAAGFLVPLALAELLYRAVFGPPELAAFTRPSYLALLRFKFASEGHFDLVAPFFYPRMYTRVEGLGPALLAGLGLAWNLRPRRPGRLIAAAAALVPVVALSLAEERLARAVSAALPWTAVAGGLLLADLLAGPGLARRLAGAALALATAIGAALHLPPVLQVSSGYAAAVDWIRAQGHGVGHFSTMMPISVMLAGERRSFYPPPELEELARASRELGFRYLLTDWQKHVWFHPSIERIEERCPPALVMPNPMIAYPTVLNENYLPADADRLRQVDRTLGSIAVFDLADCLPRLGLAGPAGGRGPDPGGGERPAAP